MNERTAESAYRILSASVTGASHLRSNLPNQDAFALRPETADGYPLCVAVSDGHGSAASFRSDVGSRWAAATAVDVVHLFLESHRASPPHLVKRTAEERLPREIHRAWTEKVRGDADQRPFTPEELEQAEVRGGAKAIQKIRDNPLVVYGATLLVVGVTDTALIFVQLGDGDILTVDDDGEVSRPLPADARSFADETVSLCLPEAWRDFRCSFHAVSEQPPALITLSSDGYANCFAGEDDFLKTGRDWLELIRKQGVEQVEPLLEGHLQSATQKYSGDDITLGILWFPSKAATAVADEPPPSLDSRPQ